MVNGHPAPMADSLMWQGVLIHVDDLAVRAQSVGVVVACFELESDLLQDGDAARGKLEVQVDGDEGALAS